MPVQYNNFTDFYRFYLSQHQHPCCRYFHYLGLSLVLIGAAFIVISAKPLLWLLLLPVLGYGCSWLGHYGFERNTPATFSYPLYSFISDWVMYRNWLLSPFKSSD